LFDCSCCLISLFLQLLDYTSQISHWNLLAETILRRDLAILRLTCDGMSESGLWHLHAKVIRQSRLPLRFRCQQPLFPPVAVRPSFISDSVMRPSGVARLQTRFLVKGDCGEVWW
jgi:hypothetical protein